MAEKGGIFSFHGDFEQLVKQAQQSKREGSRMVEVNPGQMRLLRKMSSTGLCDADLPPYTQRKPCAEPDPLPALPFTFMMVLLAPLVWVPWGSWAYCACIPLLITLIGMAYTFRDELQKRKVEHIAALELEALMRARKGGRNRRASVASSVASSRRSHTCSNASSPMGSMISSRRKSLSTEEAASNRRASIQSQMPPEVEGHQIMTNFRMLEPVQSVPASLEVEKSVMVTQDSEHVGPTQYPDLDAIEEELKML